MRRGWIGWVVGLIVILALLWVGGWYALRYVAESALARYAAGGSTGIECVGATLGGFPLKVDIRCERVRYQSANGTITAAIGGLAASAPLYRPGTVEATIDAPLVVNAPAMGVALTAQWSLATASASAWFGGPTGFGASFVSLDAENSGIPAMVPIAALTAAEAAGTVALTGSHDYTLTADARRLVLTRTGGTALPALDGEAHVTLLGVGSTLGTDPLATIRDWLRRGGPSARIERFKLAGVGTVVTADGTLGLAADGRLNGSLILRWNDIARLADLIEAILPGTRERAEMPLQGLNAVSVAADTPDGPMRQTTLTFTQGVIWLGIFPLPIDPIPPIRF
jgi:hypothetical protein